MQVQRISETIYKKNVNTVKSKKKDLTGFGIQEQNSLNDKKASDAIKTNFISNVSFKGHVGQVFYRTIGTSGCMVVAAEGKEAHETWNVSKEDTIKKSHAFHANSELIVNKKGESSCYEKSNVSKIYFLDPEEVISRDEAQKYQYIVKDNEPKLPKLWQMREKYYSTGVNQNDCCSPLKERAGYFCRLEEADMKTLDEINEQLEKQRKDFDKSDRYKKFYDAKKAEFSWEDSSITIRREISDYYYLGHSKKKSELENKRDYYLARIENSRKEQKNAIGAYNIYNETGKLFIDKDNQVRILSNVKSDVERAPRLIAEYKLQLEKAKSDKKQQEDELDTSKKWKEMQEKSTDKNSSEMYRIDRTIEKHEQKIESLKQEISNLESRIQYQEQVLANKDIVSKEQKKLDNMIAQLQKNYAKMEEFYKKNYPECCK